MVIRTRHVLLLPLLRVVVTAPTTGDQPTLMYHRTLERNGFSRHKHAMSVWSQTKKQVKHTFDLLAPLPAHKLGHVHRVAHERVPAAVVHGALDGGVELDDVDGKAGAVREGAEFVVDGLDEDGVERDEGRLARALRAHILR